MHPVVRKMLHAKGDPGERWEISLHGQVVGWIQAHKIQHARSVFYKALGIDPTGEVVNLENSTILQDRINVVVDFHQNPERYKGVHWHPRDE